jgi:hypothetical protein
MIILSVQKVLQIIIKRSKNKILTNINVEFNIESTPIVISKVID